MCIVVVLQTKFHLTKKLITRKQKPRTVIKDQTENYTLYLTIFFLTKASNRRSFAFFCL